METIAWLAYKIRTFQRPGRGNNCYEAGHTERSGNGAYYCSIIHRVFYGLKLFASRLDLERKTFNKKGRQLLTDLPIYLVFLCKVLVKNGPQKKPRMFF